LQWGQFFARGIEKKIIDVVQASFNKAGFLTDIVPYLDYPKEETLGCCLDDLTKAVILKAIVDKYNFTRDFCDKKRPLVLKKELIRWVKNSFRRRSEQISATAYIERILSSIFISFETIASESERFQIPDFIKSKHPGFGFLTIICRLTKQYEIDLWLYCHHSCVDGVPVQEMLQRLKRDWGAKRLALSSSLFRQSSDIRLCSTDNGFKGVYCTGRFICFTPFLQYRRQRNRRNTDKVKITPFRFVIWKMGNHPVFRGKKFIIPVDLRKGSRGERTLGFILIRPSIYYDVNKPDLGVIDFEDEFSRQIKGVLSLRGESHELFESYALLSPALFTLALKVMPSAIRELSASIGVTTIERSELFIAPFSDVQTEGFLAFSRFSTPAENGDKACFVSAKGPKNKVASYLEAVSDIASLRQGN